MQEKDKRKAKSCASSLFWRFLEDVIYWLWDVWKLDLGFPIMTKEIQGMFFSHLVFAFFLEEAGKNKKGGRGSRSATYSLTMNSLLQPLCILCRS